MYDVRNFFPRLVLALFPACQAPPAGPPMLDPTYEATRERLTGPVTEELAAGTYTYFRLRLGDGDERWVVLSGRKHRGARRLAVDCHGRSREFVSPRLGRSFAPLHFCSPVTPPDA